MCVYSFAVAMSFFVFPICFLWSWIYFNIWWIFGGDWSCFCMILRYDYTLRRLLITSRPLCICITEGLIIGLHYKPLMVYVYTSIYMKLKVLTSLYPHQQGSPKALYYIVVRHTCCCAFTPKATGRLEHVYTLTLYGVAPPPRFWCERGFKGCYATSMPWEAKWRIVLLRSLNVLTRQRSPSLFPFLIEMRLCWRLCK